MADTSRRGFGPGEVALVVVALCVMVAVGIAGASAFSQGSEVPDASGVPTSVAPAAATPLQPVAPDVVTAPPVAAGSRASSQWVADIARRTGIGAIAVDAYGSAALRLSAEQPSCRLGWTTLAGIGGIESLHGTDGGAHLLPDGRTSQPIIGPALDGTGGNGAIRSTAESVQWHGDTTWDHAVGPLQFIPTTWERWASDGDGDGTSDPSDIVDAAYAAGRYLCASGADLTTAAGWTAAVFSYNHSDTYVRTVLAYANAYAAR